MQRKNEFFAESIKNELSNMMLTLTGKLEVAQRTNFRNNGLSREQAGELCSSMNRGLQYIQWLIADLADIMLCQKKEFEACLVQEDITEQLELVKECICQQISDRNWKGTILLEKQGPLYAPVNPGLFYTVCVNIIANLYYYTSADSNASVVITDHRTVEFCIPGVQLPEMVTAAVERQESRGMECSEGTGTFGLICASMICTAMGWRMILLKEPELTRIILMAPEQDKQFRFRERLASDGVLRMQQRSQAALRASRAFGGLFGGME